MIVIVVDIDVQVGGALGPGAAHGFLVVADEVDLAAVDGQCYSAVIAHTDAAFETVLLENGLDLGGDLGLAFLTKVCHGRCSCVVTLCSYYTTCAPKSQPEFILPSMFSLTPNPVDESRQQFHQ